MIPLAEKLRPQKIENVVGQEHLVGKDGIITNIIKSQNPLSILLFGPPGCGKTTIARLYANAFNANFKSLSAVFSGVGDLKKIINEIEKYPLFNKRTILFVDEIHRFNKTQQDAFLPFIENGTIILVGATTENPSFSLNNALLSRLRILTLKKLSTDSLKKILLSYEKNNKPINLKEEEENFIFNLASGDGRYLLNMLENIESIDGPINLKTLEKIVWKKASLYDKHADEHFNLISALHKSIRGSDPDAALYWLARMLDGGEDPLYIARRLIRMAMEDIGLADIEALPQSLNAYNTYKMLGSPEGELALAQTVIYLALAPKSNSCYTAFKEASKTAKNTNHLTPPLHILNAPTQFMKDQGYSKGYKYDHDEKDSFSGQNYFPDDIEEPSFYKPKERGFEREMVKRISYFKKLKQNI